MAECPRCHLEFRSRIYCKVEKSGWHPDGNWHEVLECGHHRTFAMPTEGLPLMGPFLADRRACDECLAVHHKELGVA